jgi:hypothetical protein
VANIKKCSSQHPTNSLLFPSRSLSRGCYYKTWMGAKVPAKNFFFNLEMFTENDHITKNNETFMVLNLDIFP